MASRVDAQYRRNGDASPHTAAATKNGGSTSLDHDWVNKQQRCPAVLPKRAA